MRAAGHGRGIDDLVATVRSRPARCGPVRVVCIDGPAGSGKTSVADRLSTALTEAPVVHMDDLYGGWDVDLEQLAGSIRDWLLTPWSRGAAGRHPVYDWAAGEYGGWRDVPAEPVVIIEGVGAGARGIRSSAVALIWVEAPDHLLLDRVLRRDGAAVREPMLRWRERERAHFESDGTRAAADIRVCGRPGADRVVPIDP